MSHQSNIIKRPVPQPWATIQDYAVIDCRGNLIVCPYLHNLRHKGYSTVFDFRHYRDHIVEGINRAAKYTKRI